MVTLVVTIVLLFRSTYTCCNLTVICCILIVIVPSVEQPAAQWGEDVVHVDHVKMYYSNNFIKLNK